MNLTPIMLRYVLHWGEMGTRWGVNRTVAQIHALVYLSPEPLNAETIAETLSVARSNVSTSLRELQSWGLVNVSHVIGDRRDHFSAKCDTWEMFMTIVEERKRRELEPTLSMLRQCAREMDADKDTPEAVKQRIRDVLSFVSGFADWFDQVKALPRPTLITLMKMGARVAKLMPKRSQVKRASA